MTDVQTRALRLSGGIGLLAALLVGIGEWAMQFNPAGGYAAADYAYFAAIPGARLGFGHFLGSLAAPLYLAGYAHIYLGLRPAPPALRWGVAVLGAYGMTLGAIWYGGRIDLALLVHARASADAHADALLAPLLAALAAHNEPLIQVTRIAVGLASLAWIVAVARGWSLYPRWMALCSPALWLALVFALWWCLPAIGNWLLPAAMNVAHALFFALSLWVLRKPQVPQKVR